MGNLKKWYKLSQAVMCMVLVSIFLTGMQLLSRVIFSEGAFVYAIMTYRHLVASLCVAPFVFFLERKKENKLSWSVCFWIFASATTGISIAIGLFYWGLKDTTAAYATNILNLIPIVTFIFSTIVGIEKLRLNTKAGKIKIAGAILCVGGALTISLYKGKTFHIGNHSLKNHSIATHTNHNWTRGSFFLVGSCLSYAIWFIVQGKLLKLYPLKYSATMFMCIIASVQSAVVGLCIDRRVEAWKLGWNLQLITIFYSGALATAASFCLVSWVVTEKGPTYPSVFTPVTLILVTLFEALFLGELLSVGSLLGMCLIIFGLYAFLWGQSNWSNGLHALNITAIEVATTIPTTVMPTNYSPADNVIMIEENADKKNIEAGYI